MTDRNWMGTPSERMFWMARCVPVPPPMTIEEYIELMGKNNPQLKKELERVSARARRTRDRAYIREVRRWSAHGC